MNGFRHKLNPDLSFEIGDDVEVDYPSRFTQYIQIEKSAGIDKTFLFFGLWYQNSGTVPVFEEEERKISDMHEGEGERKMEEGIRKTNNKR